MKKKALVVFLALSMLSAEMFCTSAPAFAEETAAESGTTDSDSEEAAEPGTTASDSEKSAAASVMSYEEFIEAALDSPVTVETYVQAKQAWIKDSSAANLYTQNEEGAYFIYKLPMTKKEYKKLKEGQKIRISGRKHQWLGNIEIAGVSFEILEGSYIAEAQDITDLLGTEDLADYKNRKVCFKGMKSVDFEDPGGDLLRYAYGPDGNGDRGDDLYFCAETGNEIYTFVIESRFFDSETELYKAVENLEEDSIIDLEGFLYWEKGALPHITELKVTKTADEAAEDAPEEETVSEPSAEGTDED